MHPFRLTAVAALGAAALVAPTAARRRRPDQGEREGVQDHRSPEDAQARREVHVHALATRASSRTTCSSTARACTTSASTTSTPSRPARARRSRSRSRAPGKYRFYCAIKGHAAKGMRGTSPSRSPRGPVRRGGRAGLVGQVALAASATWPFARSAALLARGADRVEADVDRLLLVRAGEPARIVGVRPGSADLDRADGRRGRLQLVPERRRGVRATAGRARRRPR